jgi:hypothetical protein
VAERPVFVPRLEGMILVDTHMVEFSWSSGMAISQKQKSIASLHEVALTTLGLQSILEISTKSPNALGVALSAFNLIYRAGSGRQYPLESIYQSAKVFSNGGPYRDIRDKRPIEAKQDVRLKESGHLLNFSSGGLDWPLEPKTVFYDWLYLNVLRTQRDLANQLVRYDGFTDIEFNPKKSINCQAYSAALFVALKRRSLLEHALTSKDLFIDTIERFSRGSTQEDTPKNGQLAVHKT